MQNTPELFTHFCSHSVTTYFEVNNFTNILIFLTGGGDVRDVAQALVYLLRNSIADIGDSIEAPRVRILTPVLQTEDTNHHLSFNDSSTLKNEGFALEAAPPVYPSINVIQKVNDTMTAHADSRGFGIGVTF